MPNLPTPIQQIINNGAFLNDPSAETVYASFEKAKINFASLWNMAQNQGYEKIFLSLSGIDTSVSEMEYIAAAIERGKLVDGAYGTPFSIEPAGREPLFYTATPLGNTGGTANETDSFEYRFYRVHKKGQIFGGNGGVLIESSDVSPAGSYTVGAPDENPGLYISLSDIGSTNVWTAFNRGKPAPNLGDPWTVSGLTLVTATQNGLLRTWNFTGNQRLGIDSGNWGGSNITDPDYLSAQQADFDLLSNQPSLPENEFRFHDYDDIEEMMLRQAEQKNIDLILVRDAQDDENIQFSETETRRQALYRLRTGARTESIGDYILLACPYRFMPQTLQEITEQGNRTNKNIIIEGPDGLPARLEVIDESGKWKTTIKPNEVKTVDIDQVSQIAISRNSLLQKIILEISKGDEKAIYTERGVQFNESVGFPNRLIFPEVLEGNVEETFATREWTEQNNLNFSTQIITSGGNYNNLEVTADLLVFTNENAQAVLNGVWGKKEFHILNLSENYEVRINHDSGLVEEGAYPIKLPTNNGSVGIKGTARVLYTESYGYFVADTWGSKYRPEFQEIDKTVITTVDENQRAGTMEMTEYEVFRDAQTVPMSNNDLNTAYPLAERPFNVVCPQLGLIYKKVNNSPSEWLGVPMGGSNDTVNILTASKILSPSEIATWGSSPISVITDVSNSEFVEIISATAVLGNFTPPKSSLNFNIGCITGGALRICSKTSPAPESIIPIAAYSASAENKVGEAIVAWGNDGADIDYLITLHIVYRKIKV